MKCLISGKDTNYMYKDEPLHKSVLNFAKFYRDKLNIEQRQKKLKALQNKVLVKGSDNTINLISCLNLFVDMRNENLSWEEIVKKLKKELKNKDLITDEEFKNEFC